MANCEIPILTAFSFLIYIGGTTLCGIVGQNILFFSNEPSKSLDLHVELL